MDFEANPMQKILAPLLALAVSACAAEAQPPKTPEAPTPAAQTKAPAGADPFAVTGPTREEWMPLLKPPVIDPAKTKLQSPPPGLAPPPAMCATWAARKSTPNAKCADAAAGLVALDAAMAQPDGEKRDVALADLESCTGLPAGVARALRGENAPVECGEALAEPMLKAPPAGMNGLVYHALLGQAIASRLARAAHNAPVLAPPHDRARVLEFIKTKMRPWFEEQARAIEEVSRSAAELPYYGKGIAAIESGVADLRLVEAARNAPIPAEFAKDEELKNAYYGSLDQWLDPRKDRGRDAALVGLKELALVGVIHDPRVDRARTMLSRLYGGRRVDALDVLILPVLPKAAPTNVEERLAGVLPTLYAGLLLEEQAAAKPGILRMLLQKGLPLPQRMALRSATLTPEASALYARGRLDLGRAYWRGVDFDLAATLASASRTAVPSEETTFLLALALALRSGPEDAADMMRKTPRALGSAQTAALDVVAHQSPAGRLAGAAAFDAAVVHQLAAPEGADAAYWHDVAERYKAAAALLTDAAQRAVADDRAKAAEALAKAVAEGAPKPAQK
ncbi:Hypothetical protein A7982_06303 [Minicystis rosea]|nr:Hypothetical protein A7982_06303 [Minicystis rosea]